MVKGALSDRFTSVAKKIRADFEAAASTQHHGSRGMEREEILQRFLSLYLPGTVEVVHNAEIITAEGLVSPQCDIVVIDKSAPRLEDMKSHRVIPAECVYGVIEVKSRLTGPELREACSKIAQVKQLPRTSYAFDPGCQVRYGDTVYEIMPMFGLVFAYDSISINGLSKRFIDWCLGHPADTHPDSLWILGRGILAWGPSGGAGPLVSRVIERRDREVRELLPYQERDVLLGLIVIMTSLLSGIRLPPLVLGNYLSPGVFYAVGTRRTPYEPFK